MKKPNIVARLGIYLFLPLMMLFNPTVLVILYIMKKLKIGLNPIKKSLRVNKTNYYYSQLFELD